jgi:hypothetical protein
MKKIYLLLAAMLFVCAFARTPRIFTPGGNKAVLMKDTNSVIATQAYARAHGGGITTIDTTKTDAAGHYATQHDAAILRAAIASAASSETMLTTGGRTTLYTQYCDSVLVTAAQIKAGLTKVLIRAYAGDTLVDLERLQIEYKYSAPVYSTTLGDSIYILGKYHNGTNLKIVHIANSYLTQAYSGFNALPVATDMLDLNAAISLVIPASIYTSGYGHFWLRYKYKLLKRTNF